MLTWHRPRQQIFSPIFPIFFSRQFCDYWLRHFPKLFFTYSWYFLQLILFGYFARYICVHKIKGHTHFNSPPGTWALRICISELLQDWNSSGFQILQQMNAKKNTSPFSFPSTLYSDLPNSRFYDSSDPSDSFGWGFRFSWGNWISP